MRPARDAVSRLSERPGAREVRRDPAPGLHPPELCRSPADSPCPRRGIRPGLPPGSVPFRDDMLRMQVTLLRLGRCRTRRPLTTSPCLLSYAAAAVLRRRNQARRPPPAKIRPGKPAPATGPGTAVSWPLISPPVKFEV